MDQHFLPPIIALLIPIVALMIPLSGLVLTYVAKIRKTALLHETIRKFAELGQPIPPELLMAEEEVLPNKEAYSIENRTRKTGMLLRQSVIGMGLGIGLAAMLYLLNLESGNWSGDMSWAIGLVPLMLGMGWWLVWRHESAQLTREKQVLAARTD